MHRDKKMAISKEVQEDYGGLIMKYLRKQELQPKALVKRRDYIRNDIIGTAAIILLVAAALTLAVTISALRRKPSDVPKLIEQGRYYAPLDAGFIKRTPELVEAANVKISNSLYDTWKDSQVSPDLFKCAQALDEAASHIDAMNPEMAKTELDSARAFWLRAVKQMGSTEETRLLTDRIINAKQALAELGVEMELIRAKAILEMISSDIFPGISVRDKTQKNLELIILKRFITQMSSSVSIQNPELNKQIKDILAQITALLQSLGE
jgi:hypothetical protein